MRKKLVEESEPLTEEFHARVGTGFEQWFRDAGGPGAPPPSVWKMDAIVLMLLYPIVFLWGVWVGGPFLANLPFAVQLFVGNIFSVGVTGFAVPWVANRMGWWLNPKNQQATLLGYGLVFVIYLVSVVVFWKFFRAGA